MFSYSKSITFTTQRHWYYLLKTLLLYPNIQLFCMDNNALLKLFRAIYRCKWIKHRINNHSFSFIKTQDLHFQHSTIRNTLKQDYIIGSCISHIFWRYLCVHSTFEKLSSVISSTKELPTEHSREDEIKRKIRHRDHETI